MGLLIVSDNPVVLEDINNQSLSACQLSETEWMHSWIKENYQLFFGKLNYELIGQEINVTGTGSEGYLDFLAIDLATGKTIILEAKRDDYKHRDLIGQAIEYAAGISKFSNERLNEIYQEFIGSKDSSLNDLFTQQSFDFSLMNSKQQIVLVVQKSKRNQGTMLRLKASCSYLREQGVDINILEISWYTRDPQSVTPQKGDIIESNFVWEIDINQINNKVSVNEDAFLIDKTDVAIELYRSIVNMFNSKQIKIRRRPAANYITFYGKSKAFMIIKFFDDHIKLRLRLPENYSNDLVEKVSLDYDKLAVSDNFLISN